MDDDPSATRSAAALSVIFWITDGFEHEIRVTDEMANRLLWILATEWKADA